MKRQTGAVLRKMQHTSRSASAWRSDMEILKFSRNFSGTPLLSYSWKILKFKFGPLNSIEFKTNWRLRSGIWNLRDEGRMKDFKELERIYGKRAMQYMKLR
jgi:hypothetical protein